MNYMSMAILAVCSLTAIVMAESFRSGLQSARGWSHALSGSFISGGFFVLYAVVDYLLIVPGKDYLMT